MLIFLRSLSKVILLLVNGMLAVLFIACCLAPRMHPKDWWFTGFLGLFFPFLFLSLLVFLVLWLILKPRLALFPFFVLVVGLIPFSVHFSLRLHNDFNLVKEEKTIRLMDWNVRHFVPFSEDKFKPHSNGQHTLIYNEIKRLNPDILCMQEFLHMPGEGKANPLYAMKSELGFPYHEFEGENIFGSKEASGIAIFSKFPIVRSGLVLYPSSMLGSAEHTVFADLKVNEDTIRVYSVHLQSYGFGDREYHTIDDIEHNTTDGESIHLLRKMRNTFYWHGIQSDFVKNEMDASPFPVLMAGDMNDVPNSYAYARLKGNMQDNFLEKGSFGLGATFNSATSNMLRLLPTLRIDYILSDDHFETIQFAQGGNGISDHAFLVSDIKLR
jgi:endonuclease/exonuclease/phosphatase family metal-dependent hydrolase